MSMHLSIIGTYDAKKDPQGLDIYRKKLFLEFFDLREKFPNSVDFGVLNEKNIIIMVVKPKIYTEKVDGMIHQYLSYNMTELRRFKDLTRLGCTIMLNSTYSDFFEYKSSIVHFNEKDSPLSCDQYSKIFFKPDSCVNHFIPFGMPVQKIALKEGKFFKEVEYTTIEFLDNYDNIYNFCSRTIGRCIPKNIELTPEKKLSRLVQLAEKERYEISKAS